LLDPMRRGIDALREGIDHWMAVKGERVMIA
jgi:hypothetical protein